LYLHSVCHGIEAATCIDDHTIAEKIETLYSLFRYDAVAASPAAATAASLPRGLPTSDSALLLVAGHYCYMLHEVLVVAGALPSDKVSTIADHEIPLLEQITPKEIQKIDEVRSRVFTPSQTFNVDSFFHLRQVSLHQEQLTFWHLIVTTTVCTLAILETLYFSLRSHVHNFIPCCHSTNTTIEPSTVTSNPSLVIPEPSQRTQFPRNDELQRDVTFTAYPLKQAE